jgi:anthranilate/para-aminobenzoate synthase component I
MRILDELEPVRRGVYSGALGYFDLRGGADLCVVIRTILLRDGRAYLHTGGGIVADSSSADEWQESMDKARLLEAALEAVG